MIPIRFKRKTSKLKAVKTVIDGITFDSKLEASYFERVVKPMLASGEWAFCKVHDAWYLPGEVRVVWDFVGYVRTSTGFAIDEVIDVKGVETQQFKRNKKLFEACYPLKVTVIKRGEF